MGRILPLVLEPSKLLHQASEKVQKIDAKLVELIENMFATMYASNGIGLAAVQVGYLQQVIIIDIDRACNKTCSSHEHLHNGKPLVIINPEITYQSEELYEFDEGCLSFPGISIKIKRPAKIVLKYQDITGEFQRIEADSNLLSVCIQHEVDHTNGIVMLNHLSYLKRKILLKKISKAD